MHILKILLRFVGVAIFGVGAVMMYFVLTAKSKAQTEIPEEFSLVDSNPRHPVTEKMIRYADAMKKQTAPEFELKDETGANFSLSQFKDKKPVVLIAVLDGCPCNIDSQPLLNNMEAKFKGKAQFFGLFSQTAKQAKDWKAANAMKYPMLIDPDAKVSRKYKLENSVYTVLINEFGTIEKVWPGYSQDMLREMDSLLSKATGVKNPVFDVAYAPKKYSSGCTIYQGEATEGNQDANPGKYPNSPKS